MEERRRRISVKTIFTFFKTDFVLRKPGTYQLDAALVAAIEAENPFLRVKQIEVWEWYSDNTSNMVDCYTVDPGY
jgi:hypothetical protein